MSGPGVGAEAAPLPAETALLLVPEQAPAVLPRYAELPELGELGLRHSRGVLPPSLGTLSLIGDEQIRRAAGLVRDGKTFSLNLAVDAFEPPLFGRRNFTHSVIAASRNEAEDVFDCFNPQASSQIDGLAHVRAREHGYYDGSTDIDSARATIGMENWAQRGICTRAVLVDLQAIVPDPFSGYGVTRADLELALHRQQVTLERGDVLLLNTGWSNAYLAKSPEAPPQQSWTGVEASGEMAEFLWDSEIAAVGSDNPAVENAPGHPSIGSLHRRLIPGLGMPLIELLDLEPLTLFARQSQRWDFMFVAVPLHVTGAVSSPANAMVVA